MNARAGLLCALLGVLMFLTSCGADDGIYVPVEPFVGIWDRDTSLETEGFRVYRRQVEWTRSSSFELRWGGYLRFVHYAYLGNESPTGFVCDGSWEQKRDGTLMLRYWYDGVEIAYQLTVEHMGDVEMHCSVALVQ